MKWNIVYMEDKLLTFVDTPEECLVETKYTLEVFDTKEEAQARLDELQLIPINDSILMPSDYINSEDEIITPEEEIN